MDYVQRNKEAWEEAFENKSPTWGEDIVSRIKSEQFPFLQKAIVDELSHYDLKDKVLGQFCCNNGRELLSLMGTGARRGVGFDIAENQIAFANETAKQLGMPCTFIAGDVLEIDDSYTKTFDYLFITIGALCWFKDLKAFFGKVSGCLKQKGIVIINESHPVTNMLCAPGEEGYSEETQNKLVYSYFDKTWEENMGMAYITGKPALSKTFTSFTHSMATILTSISQNGLRIQKLEEYDFDIAGGMFRHLDHQGIPLCYLLVAEKDEVPCAARAG